MFKILLADDETKIRITIKDYLSAKGFDVITAKDGADALEKFGEDEFDLIILDVMMPNFDGFDTCRAVRRRSNIPVLFLFRKEKFLALKFPVPEKQKIALAYSNRCLCYPKLLLFG